MAGSHIAVTPGSGDFIATGATYTEASTVVKDQKVLLGEQYLPTYSVVVGGLSTATTAAHLLEIMAGSTLNVRIRRFTIIQDTIATAGQLKVELRRLTSAGTGGTAITPISYDSSDPASGATAMTLPSSKGAEASSVLYEVAMPIFGVAPVTSTFLWEANVYRGIKPIIIPAGTANGLTWKVQTGVATATVEIVVELTETPF